MEAFQDYTPTQTYGGNSVLDQMLSASFAPMSEEMPVIPCYSRKIDEVRQIEQTIGEDRRTKYINNLVRFFLLSNYPNASSSHVDVIFALVTMPAWVRCVCLIYTVDGIEYQEQRARHVYEEIRDYFAGNCTFTEMYECLRLVDGSGARGERIG